MASNDLVGANSLSTAKSACKERYNSGSIPGEVISLAWLKSPFIGFFKFSESILAELLLAVIDGVKVGRRCIETVNDLAGVDTGLVE